MSEGGFLKRWSRRKRAEAAPAESAPDDAARSEEPEAVPAKMEEGAAVPAAPSGAGQEAVPTPGKRPQEIEEPEIDPASLPPLESLGPDSDYTVFLRKGVPEPLRIAALRKAWMSDPFIRDFRGPAEYALDYTTSEFDLRPTDDVAKMLDRIFPPQPKADQTEPPQDGRAEAGAESPKGAPAVPQLPQKETIPPAQEQAPQPEPASAPPRRKHGGALPDERE